MLMQNRPLDAGIAAHDRVYRTLRQQIMHGELAPAQSLTVRGLAKTFGVSRPTLYKYIPEARAQAREDA